jgi:hypothetical protein
MKSGGFVDLRHSSVIIRVWFVIVLLTLVFGVSQRSAAQEPESGPGAGTAVDSLHIVGRSIDSLLKADSIHRAGLLEAERKLENSKQLATQRVLDLTNDGKPEILRISGMLAKNIDETKLTFTIKSGKKVLFEDSWKAAGYFDTIDHLPDSVKLRRLRRMVTVAFANENFEIVDSAEFDNIMRKVSSADLPRESREAYELFREPRVMYSVFHSRDYWYGLVWDPKKNKFVKVWQN